MERLLETAFVALLPFFASVGCLNEKWEYINHLMGYTRWLGMVPSNLVVLRQVKGQERVLAAEI